MAKTSSRLRTRGDFQTLFKRGQQVRGRFLIMRRRPNQKSQDRFGFIISTKTAKRAVDRNLIKRRLRAITAQLPKSAPAAQDIVITAQPASLTATFQELQHEVQTLFSSHATSRRYPH